MWEAETTKCLPIPLTAGPLIHEIWASQTVEPELLLSFANRLASLSQISHSRRRTDEVRAERVAQRTGTQPVPRQTLLVGRINDLGARLSVRFSLMIP
jgi:hypothetical protein